MNKYTLVMRGQYEDDFLVHFAEGNSIREAVDFVLENFYFQTRQDEYELIAVFNGHQEPLPI